jgi:hypothetical protein
MALAQLIGELETLAETIPKHTDSVQQLVDVVPRLIAAAEAFEKILAGVKTDVDAIVTLDPTKTTPAATSTAAAAVTLPVAAPATRTTAPGPITIARVDPAAPASATAPAEPAAGVVLAEPPAPTPTA